MKVIETVSGMLTPVYAKTENTLPQDEMYYLLCSEGLMIGRKTPFFDSCVPCEAGPSELQSQKPFLVSRYPKLPGLLCGLIIGFFREVHRRHYAAEAIVLLYYDPARSRYHLVVPPQRAFVGTGNGMRPVPMTIRYNSRQESTLVPEHWIWAGDLHSHCQLDPYSSGVDKSDEAYRAGLHIVVGRLHESPPPVHAEIVADGQRFLLKSHLVFDNTAKPVAPPASWLAKLQVSYVDLDRVKVERESDNGD